MSHSPGPAGQRRAKHRVTHRPGRTALLEPLERRALFDAAALDGSFDADGVKYLDYRNLGGDQAFAQLVQPDGKLVVVGSGDIPGIYPTQRGAVARYNVNGTLDTTFGEGGKTAAGTGSLIGVARAAGGRLLVFGTDAHTYIPFVTALTPAGVVDTTFGASGTVKVPAVTTGGYYLDDSGGIAVMADGRFVVSASAGYELRVFRYTADGSPDPTFGGGDGLATVALTPLAAGAYTVAGCPLVSADGKILLAADAGSNNGLPEAVALVRLLADGAPDATFHGDGISQPAAGGAPVRGVARTADGAAPVALVGGPNPRLVRWTAAGALDGTFGNGGTAPAGLPGAPAQQDLFGLTVGGDGRIVAVGTNGADVAVGRFTAGGAPDATFDGDGWAFVDARSNDRGAAAAVLSDGGVAVAGTAFAGGYGWDNISDFAVLRVTAAGQPDPTWGGTGTVRTSGFRSGDDRGRQTFVLPDGKVLATSASQWYGTPHTVSRLHADGSADTTFADGGRLVGRQGDYVHTYDFDHRNGKLVILGGGYGTWSGSFTLQRLDANGAPDPTFGNGGTAGVALQYPDALWGVYDVKVLGDNRVAVVGVASGGDLVVLRYTAGGTLDAAFDGDGVAVVPGVKAKLVNDAEPSLHAFDDGSVLVAGAAIDPNATQTSSQFVLARLRPDGAPDANFGAGSGVVRLPGPAGSTVNTLNDVAVQPDGKVVASGYTRSGGGNAPVDRAAVLRVSAAGVPDAGFGQSGLVTLDFGRTAQVANAVAVQPDGKLVVAGRAGTLTTYSNGNTYLTALDGAAARLLPDGRPDTAFSGDGQLTWGTATADESFADAMVMADGRLLLTGTARRGFQGDDVALVRLMGDHVPPPAVPVPVTLRAAADAYVRDGSFAGANYGGTADLFVKRSGTAGNTRETYLRFDLASVPSVGAAKFRLFGRLSNTVNASVTTTVYNASDTTWGEPAVNWNTKPAAGTASRGAITVSGTSAKWHELDLTSFLRAEKAAGRNLVTLVLKNVTATDAQTIFASDEDATVANRPQLVVTPAGPPPQGIVVSTSNLSVPEGGSAAFTVKLAAQPSANVVVDVAKSSTGDPNLSVATSTLTFTPVNWNAAQSVSVSAAEDADQVNGTAAFTVSSSGLTGKVVTAAEADNDAPAAVTLRAAADAYVRDGTYAGTNYGGATQLQAKQAGAGYYRESYLRFDLSAAGPIASAKLRLFGKLDNTQAAGAGFTVYNSSNTTWSQSAVTYNSRLTSGTTARGSGTVTGTTAKWYEVDLTAFLKAEKAAGRNVVTLVIKATASSPSTILFDSGEGANRPELVVTQ